MTLTRRERAAQHVIESAWAHGPAQHLATQAVQALEHAGMLLCPERAAEIARATTTVYRAEHHSIVFGLYTSAAEAQRHCEHLVRTEHPAGTPIAMEWIGLDDLAASDPIELAATVGGGGGGDEQFTGYTVTPLEVAARFDPASEDDPEAAPPAAAPGAGGPGPQDATVQLRDAEPIHLTGWQLLHATTGEGQDYTQLTGWVTVGQPPQARRCGMVWAYLPDHCPHTLAGARDVHCEVAYGPGPRPHLTLRWPTRPADRADHYTGVVA